MQTIQLAPQLPAFSRLIYGVWRLNDAGDSKPSETVGKIHACLDQGITTFDHADIYGNYSCEASFGQALRLEPALKNRMQIITKCDIALATDKFPQRSLKYYDTSAAYLNSSVDNSLQRLGVDAIDVLLIHRPDPFMDTAETGAALDSLIQTGKIKAAGVSNFMNHDWDLLQSGMKNKLVSNQIEVSLLCHTALHDGTLAQAQRLQAPPMAWSPLAGGALFGDGAAAQRVLPALKKLAAEFNVGVDAVAIAWLLAHPAKIMPVLGTNNMARIQTLSDSFKVKLDRETWYSLTVLAQGHDVP